MKHHHNTTHEIGQTLLLFEQKAMTQEQVILNVFKRQHLHMASPSIIWKLTGQKWPITSVRRAITNLSKTDPPRLKQTRNKHLGLFGRAEHVWKLAAF